jgi:hypothetical protein
MKSLGEPRYMVEPAGAYPATVYHDGNGTARIVIPFFSGKASRVVFMRGDILMAWVFYGVTGTGGDLTVEFNLL